MSEDYRVTVKVRNNRLLEAIEASGHACGLKFAKLAGVSYQSLWQLVAMTLSPQTPSGEWRAPVLKLADFLGVLPDEIFTDSHLIALADNKAEFKMDAAEIELLTGAREVPALEEKVQAEELRGKMREALATLPGRTRQILEARFGLNGAEPKMLKELAKEWGLSVDRVRQIEAKGLQFLRNPKRSHELRDFNDRDYSNRPEHTNRDGWTIHEPEPPAPAKVPAPEEEENEFEWPTIMLNGRRTYVINPLED